MKKILIFISLSIYVFILSGCGGPSGDPEIVLKNYMNATREEQFSVAYDLLTESNKEIFNLEEFTKFYKNYNTAFVVNDYNVTKVSDEKDVKYTSGLVIPRVVTFDLELDMYSRINNISIDGKQTAEIIDDNKQWKLNLYSMFVFKSYYTTLSNAIGFAYYSGEQVDFKENVDKAIEYFNDTIKVVPEDNQAYNHLMMCYLKKEMYKEAVENGKIYYERLTDRYKEIRESSYRIEETNDLINKRSNVLTMLAYIYLKAKDKDKALYCLENALRINSLNTKAQQLLKKVKQY